VIPYYSQYYNYITKYGEDVLDENFSPSAVIVLHPTIYKIKTDFPVDNVVNIMHYAGDDFIMGFLVAPPLTFIPNVVPSPKAQGHVTYFDYSEKRIPAAAAPVAPGCVSVKPSQVGDWVQLPNPSLSVNINLSTMRYKDDTGTWNDIAICDYFNSCTADVVVRGVTYDVLYNLKAGILDEICWRSADKTTLIFDLIGYNTNFYRYANTFGRDHHSDMISRIRLRNDNYFKILALGPTMITTDGLKTDTCWINSTPLMHPTTIKQLRVDYNLGFIHDMTSNSVLPFEDFLMPDTKRLSLFTVARKEFSTYFQLSGYDTTGPFWNGSVFILYDTVTPEIPNFSYMGVECMGTGLKPYENTGFYTACMGVAVPEDPETYLFLKTKDSEKFAEITSKLMAPLPAAIYIDWDVVPNEKPCPGVFVPNMSNTNSCGC